MLYESLAYPDPTYPVICHSDHLWSDRVFNAHWHENYEILALTSGRMELLLDGRRLVAQAGQCVVIGRGVLHFFQSLTEECTYHCLLADGDFLKKRGLPASDAGYCEVIDDLLLSQMVADILAGSVRKEPLYQMEVRARIDLLFVHLSRHYLLEGGETLPDRSTHAAIKRAVRFIHAHYDQPLTLEDICRQAGFAKNYFCRLFAEYTGQPPIRYLYRVRCEDARRLLAAGECSVTEVAQRCGFCSVSHFSQYYRRTFGCTPSQDIVKK